jgi:hypothetical protein
MPASTAYNSEAKGVWTVRDAERLTRDNLWTSNIPIRIPGLQIWFDASDSQTLFDATSGGSLVAIGGSVARWEDKSGNKRHMTQSVAESRPLLQISSGNRVVVFDGIDDVLSQLPFSLTNFSMFVRGDNSWRRGQDGQGDGWSITGNAIVNLAPAQVNGPSGNLTTNIRSLIYDSGVALSNFNNGVKQSASATSGTGLRTSTIGFMAGRFNSAFFATQAREIVVYDRVVTDSEALAIISFLANKNV